MANEQWNEKVKITANLWNNLSTAFFVVGGVTPLVEATLGPTVLTQPSPGNFSIVTLVVWLSGGLALHWRAKRVLSGFWTMNEIQILAIAAPLVIVAIAVVHTWYVLRQKPPTVDKQRGEKRTAAVREHHTTLQG
jgi:hypothetical protein